MTTEPTPEAIALTNALAVPPSYFRRAALALDALGAALLWPKVDVDLVDALVSLQWATEKLHAEEAESQLTITEKQLMATRKELGEWRDMALAAAQSLRKPAAARERWPFASKHPGDCACPECVELESRRKPLEGELVGAWRAIVRFCSANVSANTPGMGQALNLVEAALRAKGAFDIAHLEHGCAEAFVSLEAKARGGETLAVHQSEWLSAEAARLRAKGAPQAFEPPEPRAIVVGSTWSVDGNLLEVAFVAGQLIRLRTQHHKRLESWNADVFRRTCAWLSDPPDPTAECHHHRLTRECHECKPATPAPKLPKRQAPLVIIGPNRTENEP